MHHQISFDATTASQLALIATPIGNLQEFSPRAISLLEQADRIYAEDTRVSGKLLQFYNIKTKLTSYHDLSEATCSERIADQLTKQKLHFVLMSDAGLPLIADPGTKLVKACLKRNINVIAAGINCAYVHAYVCSGLVSGTLTFHGFLARKQSARAVTYRQWHNDPATTFVAYESPRRILTSLGELASDFPLCQVVVGKELTKQHEQFFRGSAVTVHKYLAANPSLCKGEFTLVAKCPAITTSKVAYQRACVMIDHWKEQYHLSSKTAIALIAEAKQLRKNELAQTYYDSKR